MGCSLSVALQRLNASTTQAIEGGRTTDTSKPQVEEDETYSTTSGGFRHSRSAASQYPEQLTGSKSAHASRPSSASIQQLLSTRKWKILMDWCGWHDKDQFGFGQPCVRDILGPCGRSKLGGHERPHEYQVAVSFPGAEFVKGDHGHCSNLTDAQGRLIATNGAEMAEAVRGWLVEDWLGGDARKGLTHVFIDKLNLQHCAGSVRAVNFGRGNPDAYAVLNENWAIYLREAFLEARVVVFLLNQDWLDSIPCNQEFEGLIRRKSTYATDGARRAVVFVDITDPDYTGRLLPQYFANMRQQAEKYFDVHTLTYNETLSPEQKAQARQSLTTIVRQYSTAYEVPSAEIEDMARTTVQWRNWLYFRCLEGTNGWRELLDVQDCNWRQALADSREGRWPRPSFQCTTQGVLSRRFRLRVTRLGDGRFGEIQLVGWELFDAASGENIVRPGNGYIRAPGGLNPASSAMIDMGMGAWCHKCGSRQYTWLEWLVPNDQPPVAVSGMRLSGHPVKEGSSPADVSDAQQPLDFTLECIPVDVCAEHPPEFLQDYERPLSKDDLIHLKGEKPQRWITLDSREGAPLAGAADGQWVGFTPDSAALDAAGRPGPGGPRCVGFRLRFTSVAEEEAASEVDVQGLRLQVVPEDDLRPLCGGACSGSGGDFPAERCGPAAAFDGHGWTRWVDARAGGIGNTAVWEYEHTEEAVVEAYTITSQVGTFGIADGLHGAPRDWVLYTFQPAASGSETTGGTAGGDAESQGRSPTDAGDACAHPGPGWVELDRRSEVIYFNTRETKRFQIAKPQPGRRFRLVFTAVRCGCASSSLQVGDIELLARCASPSAPELLQASQALLQPSASHADMREAWWAPDDPTRLQLSLPIHANARRQHYTPPPLPQQQRQPTIMGLAGGTFKWGGMPLAAWYDWPMEFQLQCNETQDGEVVRYGSQPTIAYRTDRFKVDYGPDAVWASLSFDEDVVIAGIGLRNHFQAQPRGEPFRWRFEVWRCEGGSGSGARPEADGEGRWQVLLAVPEVRYDTHVSCGVFYLPAPSPAAQRFRFVFEEWWMPCPLAHLHTVLVLGWRAAAATAATEAVAAPCDAAGAIGGSGGAAGGGDVALRFRELASLDVMLRRWKRPARLAGYSLTAGKGRGVPTSWVLEGLTDEY